MSGNDKDDVLRLVRDQEAATARGDAKAVVAPLADDVTMFGLTPPLMQTGAAARDVAAVEEWLSHWDGGVTVEFRDPQIVVGGNVAAVFGLSRARGARKGSGPVDAWTRRTLVLERRAGAWRIVHEHVSFPARLDGSNSVASDLKP